MRGRSRASRRVQGEDRRSWIELRARRVRAASARASGTSTAAERTFKIASMDVPLVGYDFTWLPTVCQP